MFYLSNNNPSQRTRPLRSSLWLAIATGSAVLLAEAISHGASVASDYCYMRTAEGRYVELNDICGASASGGIPNRIYRPQSDEPIRTSTPAQSSSTETELTPLDEEPATEAETPMNDSEQEDSTPEDDASEDTSDAPVEGEADTQGDDAGLPDASDATDSDDVAP